MLADSPSHSYPQPKYRADLDGLRAVAVLSVIVFHAFPTVLTGGFVGVDIFFVISGFLISSIIATGLQSGNFRFIDFYSRRIRRIYPALILILICCLIAGWEILLANEYAELGQHVAAGAAFMSNLVLWAQSGYFDTASDAKPLLHLWSLGIEEQFYIFWPLLMWMAHRFKVRFLALAGVILIISFTWNVGLISTNPLSAFYLPYCRIWELLLGAMLAYQVLNGNVNRLYAKCNIKEPMALVGLLLIGSGAYALDKGRLFPGWWALLPTMGTVLLLSTEGSWINTKILSQRIFVEVGLISYPLYLWHWPLLSFGRISANGELPVGTRIALVLLAVFLAFLTYRYYEKYLRHQGRKVTAALFIGVCLVGLLGWNIHRREGLDFRYRKILTQPQEMVRDFTKWEDKGMYPKGVCDPDFVFPNSRICAQSRADTKPDTVVFGDSHAFHAYWGIARALGSRDHTVKLVGRGGCVFGLYQKGDDCEQTYQRQTQWMANDGTVKNIFIVHRLVITNDSTTVNIENYRQRMDALFGSLVGQGKHVIYFYSVPEARMNPELCGSRLPFGRKADLSGCVFPLRRELEIQDSDRELIAALLKKYPTVEIFDPSATLCKDDSCNIISNGRANWMDGNHISESASYVVGEVAAHAVHLK